MAPQFYSKYRALQCLMEVDDLVQGFVENYLARRSHDKYDPSKATSFRAWLGVGLRNWCLNCMSKRSFRFPVRVKEIPGTPFQETEYSYRETSYDVPVEGDEGPTLGELFSSPRDEDPLSAMIVEEILGKVKDVPSGPEVESPLLGTCRYSKREVIRHRIGGFKAREIGDLFGVSRGRICQVLREVRGDLERVL